MRTKPCLVIAAALGLYACGGGSSGDPDAPVTPTPDAPPGTPDAPVVIDADPLAPDAAPEFACLGQPIPNTAPNMLTVAGNMQVVGLGGAMAVVGATVSAFVVGNPTAVATTTTAAGTGAYTLTMTNAGMTPVDAYLRAPSPNNKTVFLFPPTLVYENIPMAPIRTVSNVNFPFLGTLCQDMQENANAVVAMVVTDCLGNPLQGATVTSTPAGTSTCYNMGGMPNNGATSTDVDGIGYIFNVPAGMVTVNATYMGMTLRAHAFVARNTDQAGENAINTTVVHP